MLVLFPHDISLTGNTYVGSYTGQTVRAPGRPLGPKRRSNGIERQSCTTMSLRRILPWSPFSAFVYVTKIGSSSVTPNDRLSLPPAMKSIIEARYSSGQNRVCRNRGVDSRIAGRRCTANNGTGPVRRCRARRAAPCTSSPDSKRDRFLRTTVRNVGTAAAQGQSQTSPRREWLQNGIAGSSHRAKLPR
jgi:hypothetical protein